MSSPSRSSPLQLSKKRPISLDQDPELPVVDRHVKKARVSTAPNSSRQDKKRRRKRKRTISVVENKVNTAMDRRASDAAGKDDSKPVSFGAQSLPDGAENEFREPVASSSHSGRDEFSPSPRRSSSSTKVANLFSPITSPSSKTKDDSCSPKVLDSPSSFIPQDQLSDLESQISQLKNQLAARQGQLDKHLSCVSSFQQSLTCQICIDLMYKPYALSPCGHLVCYDCLVRWFKTPAPSSPLQEENNAVYKRKTCPHCRAVVRERPIEVYVVKDMVNALDKSSLAIGLPPRKDEPIISDEFANDPWKGIFPKQSARHRHSHFIPPFIDEELPSDLETWQHPDLDSDEGHAGAVDGPMGIYDEEDEVYRCTVCLHEIWDGTCSRCGRTYAVLDEPVDLDDIMEDLEDSHYRLGGSGFAHMAFMNQAMQLGMMFLPPPPGPVGDIDDDNTTEDGDEPDAHPVIEEADEDEEDGYESSFIDDDHGPNVIDLGASDNDVIETSPPARRSTRLRNRFGDARPLMLVSDDESSDPDPVIVRRSLRISSGVARGPMLVSDDEISFPPPRIRPMIGAGPVTRSAARANARGSTRSSTISGVPSSSRTQRDNVTEDEGTTRNDDQIRWDSEEDASHSTNRFASPISDDGDDTDGEDDGSIPRRPINLAHLLQDDISDKDDGEDEDEYGARGNLYGHLLGDDSDPDEH